MRGEDPSRLDLLRLELEGAEIRRQTIEQEERTRKAWARAREANECTLAYLRETIQEMEARQERPQGAPWYVSRGLPVPPLRAVK